MGETKPESGADYKDTLNLPVTDFPMKARLNQREPEIHALWGAIGLHKTIQNRRGSEKRYILHDGPPYANGNIHMGHALNKILKDIIVRYKTMKGYHTHYIPGWDCHGLPIEQKVRQQLGAEARNKSTLEIRKLCAEYAMGWVGKQSQQFQRLGIGGDFEHPYLTLKPEYEVGILKAFRALVKNGLVYRGQKPVYWCASCMTALADAEVEYEDHTSDSIFVRFPVRNPEKVPGLAGIPNPTIVIWTTTPWTLPANVAVTVHPKYDYVAAKLADTGEVFVVAHYLLSQFLTECHLGEAEIQATFKGEELSGLECSHPLLDKTSIVVCGEHVTLEQGTGCVHTAPGHGYDDYLMLLKHDLPMVMPVDDAGRFTDLFPEMAGVQVWKANQPIIERLQESGLLLHSNKIRHSYPHCWRCHNPIIFRATDQWFMSVEHGDIRRRTLETIDKVKWIPDWGRNRIYSMMESRPDWCLSRQRKWGVPIPAVGCLDCGEEILALPIIDRFMEQVALKGSDSWFEDPDESVIPEGFCCPKCGGKRFEKKQDTLDVWFDSGSSHIAVCEQNEDLGSPVDLYLEGSDQHRGWFQSSLLISMGARGRAPYKAVLTHGFILDQKGEAMSKSKGNVIAPESIIEKLGADVLRLWVASEDYREDVKISQEIVDRISDAYRRIRNTFRFLLGNLGDFFPGKDSVPYEQLGEFDRWALHQLADLTRRVTKAYENFEFHKVYHFVHSFCVVEMSALYLDIVKDRLYAPSHAIPERRGAQTVLHEMARTLAGLLAPILPYTMEEVHQFFLRATSIQETNPMIDGTALVSSIHLEDFPEVHTDWIKPEIAGKWDNLLKYRDACVKILEEARRRKEIGHSLDARVILHTTSDEVRAFLEPYSGFMADFCIVSDFSIEKVSALDKDTVPIEGMPEVTITVEKAPWKKCSRCWKLHSETGSDNRHPETCPRCAGVLETYCSQD